MDWRRAGVGQESAGSQALLRRVEYIHRDNRFVFRPAHNPIPTQKPGIDGVVEDAVDFDGCPFGVSFRAVSVLVQPGSYFLQGPTLPATREHLPHQRRLTLVRHESAFGKVVAERRMES